MVTAQMAARTAGAGNWPPPARCPPTARPRRIDPISPERNSRNEAWGFTGCPFAWPSPLTSPVKEFYVGRVMTRHRAGSCGHTCRSRARRPRAPLRPLRMPTGPGPAAGAGTAGALPEGQAVLPAVNVRIGGDPEDNTRRATVYGPVGAPALTAWATWFSAMATVQTEPRPQYGPDDFVRGKGTLHFGFLEPVWTLIEPRQIRSDGRIGRWAGGVRVVPGLGLCGGVMRPWWRT